MYVGKPKYLKKNLILLFDLMQVLSVIAHQILSIQRAIQAGMVSMIFEDSDIKINPGCAVFVTTESLMVRQCLVKQLFSDKN